MHKKKDKKRESIDCEGDGLFPTKFYVISYMNDNGDVISLTKHKQMKRWLRKQKLLIGHNITRWDIPQLERVLNIKIKAKLIDTLAFSWYLLPYRLRHGLEYWGEDFGVPKPEVKDWHNLPLKVYVHRCEEDVKINTNLWYNIESYLSCLYECEEEDVLSLPIIGYIGFKMDCAAEQERSRWKLDLIKVKSTLLHLITEQEKKIDLLKQSMPKVPVYKTVNMPSKPYKKDGTLSVAGSKWFKVLRDHKLPKGHTEPVQTISGYDEPNPKSYPQLKEWLFSLGWNPRTFEYKREDSGKYRQIPQLKKKNEPELCESVTDLIEVEPSITHLDGRSIINQ